MARGERTGQRTRIMPCKRRESGGQPDRFHWPRALGDATVPAVSSMNQSIQLLRTIRAVIRGRRWAVLLAAVAVGAPGPLRAAGPGAIQFARDIQPLLAENCLACHGPDPAARKAGLRLDTREGLFEPTARRPATVMPGDPSRSTLWKRIVTEDPDDLMPPPESHKKLEPEQKRLIEQWILAGAPWQGHWAFVKPTRPDPPVAHGAEWVRNPVDAFILAGLEATGLAPAPEADPRALARRLALDLTGLPPAPEAVQRFLEDTTPEAYERYVQALLASPHYGEHRARYWLDAARYADTHGLHFDNYREMWPYRDWVIRAFNRNQPFDQFVVEQLAGDLLDNPTDDQMVATGFQRCNMTTNEGGTIEEENLANYANDRVTTTGWVFLGLTTNCGACHDHKFDPFTTKDFYSLAAFYRNTQQTGFDRNWREGDLYMVVPQTDEERTRWKALPAEIEAARRAREGQVEAADVAFTNWVTSVRPRRLPARVSLGGEVLRLPLTEGEGTRVTGRVGRQRVEFGGPTQIEWRGGVLGPAPILTADNGFVLGDRGDLQATEPFSASAWVFLPEDFKGGGAILGRMGGEPEGHRGWDFFVRDDHFGIHLVHRWPAVALKVRSPGKSLERGRWHHVAVTYDGSTRAEGVKLFVDGLAVAGNREQDRLEGSIHSPFPLRLGQRERGDKLEGVAVQDVRLYQRRVDPAEVAVLAVAPRLAEVLSRVDFASTNNASREVLRRYFRVTQHEGWGGASRQLAALENERFRIRGRSPVTHIQREKPDSLPTAHVLFRGQYDQPREQVTAATPGALHPFPAGSPTNRLGLARWLVAPDNPLTARVTVNRLWQEVFGVGLVKTADDFGVMGEAPVNQPLLDWLAVEFQESGWDVKRLLTLLVTSATYRQSAVSTPEKLARDPENRLLSRGPRFRMDGEMVRDYALAVSGLLVPRVGGPSVKPYQPEGVWEAVAMPESGTRYYERDDGEGLYRRSLYTFLKRAAPPPALEIFNAPSREVCTVRRERTNTPLQALATLNDPQYIEAARHLASLALARSEGAAEAALDDLAERLLARPLRPAERQVVARTLADLEAFYRAQPAEAERLVAVGFTLPPAETSTPQLAALTMVANQLLNLDEVLCK